MEQFKLIALDMDGTLLNEESQISTENRQAIVQAMDKGVTVIFATGRGVQSVLPYAEELQLQSPIVAANGGDVWKAPHNLLHRSQLSGAIIDELYALAQRYDTWYWAYAVEGLFNKEQWTERTEDMRWLKFGFYTENDRARSEIQSKLRTMEGLEVTNSHPDNMEINPAGVNKASGVQRICDMLGISMSQVVAMGDSLNDVSMIRAAGLGVAMGNAQDPVKAAADRVTLTNREHGVAKVIHEVVLGGL